MAGNEDSVGGAPHPDTEAIMDRYNGYIIDGEIYTVYRDRLWKRTGQTRNPRVIANADRVGERDGPELLSVHTDGATVELQHHMAGIEERLYAGERTDYTYVTFEEVDPIDFD